MSYQVFIRKNYLLSDIINVIKSILDIGEDEVALLFDNKDVDEKPVYIDVVKLTGNFKTLLEVYKDEDVKPHFSETAFATTLSCKLKDDVLIDDGKVYPHSWLLIKPDMRKYIVREEPIDLEGHFELEKEFKFLLE